jgi:class 3 adenylate cyclase
VARTLVQAEPIGVTNLFDRLGDQRALRILIQFDRLVRNLVRGFAGREIEKSRRFLLLFEHPLDAVHFCLDFHEEVQKLAEVMELELAGRAGIHLGEVFQWENQGDHVARGAKQWEVEGPARTTVAQVMALAGAGQTLLTSTAYELARRAAVGSEDLGYRVAWRSYGVYSFPHSNVELTVHEVGRQDSTCFMAPSWGPGESKAPLITQVTREGKEAWKPAVGQAVPQRPHWLLERTLDESSFGEVWLGVHRETRDQHAFRFCDLDDLPRLARQLPIARYLREVLEDPGFIVPILDCHIAEAPFFLETEYVNGRTLTGWCKEHGGLEQIPNAVRFELVAQLADALAAIHQLGITIGNLVPDNLLVVGSGISDVPRLLIADLSLASVNNPALPRHLPAADQGPPVPPPYCAPEAASEVADAQEVRTASSDLYALGVILYQLAVGDLDRCPGPFWQRDLDDELIREEVAGLLEPVPAQRAADASAIAGRLRALDERRAARRKQREIEAVRSVRSRRRQLVLAIGAAATAVVIIAVILLLKLSSGGGETATYEQLQLAVTAAERSSEQSSVEIALLLQMSKLHRNAGELLAARGDQERALACFRESLMCMKEALAQDQTLVEDAELDALQSRIERLEAALGR